MREQTLTLTPLFLLNHRFTAYLGQHISPTLIQDSVSHHILGEGSFLADISVYMPPKIVVAPYTSQSHVETIKPSLTSRSIPRQY